MLAEERMSKHFPAGMTDKYLYFTLLLIMTDILKTIVRTEYWKNDLKVISEVISIDSIQRSESHENIQGTTENISRLSNHLSKSDQMTKN